MSASLRTNPWSPAPWTVGASLTADTRTPFGQRERQRAVRDPRMRFGIERHPLRRQLPGRHPQDAGREHERPGGARQDRPHRFDGAGVGADGRVEVGEVVDEPQVNDAFRLGRADLQTLRLVQVAPQHLRPGGREGLGRGLRTRQPKDPVAGRDELEGVVGRPQRMRAKSVRAARPQPGASKSRR
jgi:hypothetical protein